MRILYIDLIGYIGIYNGTGLNRLSIDFRKCKNKIVIIRGDNGSGKTTLWKALNPYPDSNNNFIPNMVASKTISYLRNDGIEFVLHFIHDIKKDGSRATTKAYISKIVNGAKIELNDNGNVNSFKEILENEFDINPGFMALSMVSADDRGIVERTPSERKKIISPIIDGIEAYNTINKKMNKLYSVYKNLISNITTKIGYIGDRATVKTNLSNVNNRLNILNSNRYSKMEELASYKSKIQLLDPDGSIQSNYESLYSEIDKLNKDLESHNQRIKSLENKLNYDRGENDINKLYKKLTDDITSLLVNIQIEENNISNLLNDRENDLKVLLEKESKLQSFNSDEYNELLKNVKKIEKESNDMKKIIDKMGIDPYLVSADEYVTGLNILMKIKETIDIFKADKDLYIMEKSIEYIKNNIIPDDYSSKINDLNIKKKVLESNIQMYKNMKPDFKTLELRPTNCTIDTCPFIKESLEISKIDTESEINKLINDIDEINDEIILLSVQQEENQSILISMGQLKSIMRDIEYYKGILNKLPIDNNLKTPSLILDNILYSNFSEIDVMYKYLQYANYIEDYKYNQTLLNDYNNKISLYNEKISLIEDLSKDIQNINNKLKGLDELITDKRNSILEDKKRLSSLKDFQLNIEVLIDLYKERNNINSNINDYVSKFNTIKSNIESIKICLNNIANCQNELNIIDSQITPLTEERDILKHSLVLLNDYEEELKTYSNKFNMIEVIKKYSSPTTGIQNIFMNIYMNKTLEIANNLLSMLFNGEYTIQQYVLNENEFRIPCLGTGIMNDDISSMSLSQRSMISMIISFALLNQSSPLYNILKLDEIDGGLDSMQRRVFVDVLYKLINILNVEQSIIISHNNELDLSMCDIIYLKSDQIDQNMGGNVIFNLIN